MTFSTIPSPEDPMHAVLRIRLYESAQARKADATFLANEVDSAICERIITGAMTRDSLEAQQARFLAARLRLAASWEYRDKDIVKLTEDVCDFLNL